MYKTTNELVLIQAPGNLVQNYELSKVLNVHNLTPFISCIEFFIFNGLCHWCPQWYMREILTVNEEKYVNWHIALVKIDSVILME